MVRDSAERHRDDKFVEGGGEEEDGEDSRHLRGTEAQQWVVQVAQHPVVDGEVPASPVVVDGAGIPPILWVLVVFIFIG